MMRLLCASALAVFLTTNVSAEEVARPPTLITHVNILTMEENAGTLRDASVLLRDGNIVRLLKSSTKLREPGLHVIDGHGGWLIPGLIDCHTHYGYNNELTSFLRFGVTTILSLGDREQIMAKLPAVSARIAAGTFPGPKVYATGPIIANHIKFDAPAPARAFVREEAARGYGFIKVYNRTTREIFDAVVTEAKQHGMGVFGHMPRAIPPEYVVSHGLNVVAHMEEIFFTALGGQFDNNQANSLDDSNLNKLRPDWKPDMSRIDDLLDLMKKHDVAIIPNLVSSYHFFDLWVDPNATFDSPELKFLAPRGAQEGSLEEWRAENAAARDNVEKRMLRERLKLPILFDLTWRAKQKGILLVAGTDSPVPPMFPGKSLHEELRLLVADGFTPTEALASATRNAGILVRKYVDQRACIGVIRVGCRADLDLLSADPTADIRNTDALVGVMAQGRWYLPQTLAQRRSS